MAAYVMYQAEVLDGERYEKYKPLAAESIRKPGQVHRARGRRRRAGGGTAGRQDRGVEFPTGPLLSSGTGEGLITEARELRKGAPLHACT